MDVKSGGLQHLTTVMRRLEKMSGKIKNSYIIIFIDILVFRFNVMNRQILVTQHNDLFSFVWFLRILHEKRIIMYDIFEIKRLVDISKSFKNFLNKYQFLN